MKNEHSLKVDKLFPNPFLVGEIIFVASQVPQDKSFKIELTDEARLSQVRAEIKTLIGGENGKRSE